MIIIGSIFFSSCLSKMLLYLILRKYVAHELLKILDNRLWRWKINPNEKDFNNCKFDSRFRFPSVQSIVAKETHTSIYFLSLSSQMDPKIVYFQCKIVAYLGFLTKISCSPSTRILREARNLLLASCLRLRERRTKTEGERERVTGRFLPRTSVPNERETAERIVRSHFWWNKFSFDGDKRHDFGPRAFALAWKTDARRSSWRDRPASRGAYEWSCGASRLTSPPSSRTQAPATNRARRPTRRPTNRALAARAPARFTRQRRVNEDPWRRIDTDVWLSIYSMVVNGRIYFFRFYAHVYL